jgi:hypothetical protein
MPDMTGGCLCGLVRYSAQGEPIRSGICHCRNCQRYTGSALRLSSYCPQHLSTLWGSLRPLSTSPIQVGQYIDASAQIAAREW